MADKEYTISQTGECHCGAVAFKAEGKQIFNVYCHCKNCTRNRGVSPIHLIAVGPASGFQITKGQDKITTVGTTVLRNFCKDCGCVVNQGPVGMDFTAVLPTTFKLDGPLPEDYKPRAHTNYESRMLDMKDGLPKFKEFPPGPMMADDGAILA